jgi:DNA-directed RNA polymerase subunit RPC12/RpoP
MAEMCINCRRPKSEHNDMADGRFACPPQVRYFSACRHERRQGTGWVNVASSGGWSYTCMDCGERFASDAEANAVLQKGN